MKISVIIPVFNGEKYLAEAIDSILSQSFKDFEFIIINDRSTDHTREIISSFKDQRIVVIDNPAQFGVSKSLNIGIESARGEYVARMDADDRSLPNRFRDQIAYMDDNPSIGISGTWARTLDSKSGTKGIIWKRPKTDDETKALMIFVCPLIHPTVIFRREILNRFNLRYDENFKSAQDYELWSRAMNHVKFGNLQKIELLYRLHENSITSTKSGNQLENSEKVRTYLSEKFGVPILLSDVTLAERESWLLDLRNNSRLKDYCSQKSIDETVDKIWFAECYKNARNESAVFKRYLSSRLREKNLKNIIKSAVLLFKTV